MCILLQVRCRTVVLDVENRVVVRLVIAQEDCS